MTVSEFLAKLCYELAKLFAIVAVLYVITQY